MFIINHLQTIKTYLIEKIIQCNQKFMEQNSNAYKNGHMLLDSSKEKGINFESSNISRLWYNFSTLSTPIDCNDMKILEETNLCDFSKLQAKHSKKLRRNWTLYQIHHKHVPKTYKTIYENRQNYIKSK